MFFISIIFIIKEPNFWMKNFFSICDRYWQYMFFISIIFIIKEPNFWMKN